MYQNLHSLILFDVLLISQLHMGDPQGSSAMRVVSCLYCYHSGDDEFNDTTPAADKASTATLVGEFNFVSLQATTI